MRQQGDVVIEVVEALPHTAQRVEAVEGRFEIAHGESGNVHTVEAAAGWALFDDAGTLYLRRATGQGGTLVHTGPSRHHLPVDLPDGAVVRFRRVREVDHVAGLTRSVMD